MGFLPGPPPVWGIPPEKEIGIIGLDNVATTFTTHDCGNQVQLLFTSIPCFKEYDNLRLQEDSRTTSWATDVVAPIGEDFDTEAP